MEENREPPPEPSEWFMPWTWNWTAEPSAGFIFLVLAAVTWAALVIPVGINGLGRWLGLF